MALYVCEFSTVEKAGNDTKTESTTNMSQSMTTVETGLKEKTIAKWYGPAQESFDDSLFKNKQALMTQTDDVRNVAENLSTFILQAKTAIYDLEQDLKVLKI